MPMPKTKIPLDRGPVLFAGGGILRLTLLRNRHGEPTLLVDSTGEVSWQFDVKHQRPKRKRLTRTREE